MAPRAAQGRPDGSERHSAATARHGKGRLLASAPFEFMDRSDAVGTSSESEIRARIARLGKITFAEFMETALYHPTGGYYARRPYVGAHADYFTSPAAHPAFGALISIYLLRMWDALGRPSAFYAVEMGAGDGLLAREVVEFAQRLTRPFGDALHYVALDRSTPHGTRDAASGAYQRIVAAGSPVAGIVGCFISNELVDSFPVHRFKIVGAKPKRSTCHSRMIGLSRPWMIPLHLNWPGGWRA